MSNSQSALLAEKESGFRSVGLRTIRAPDQSSASSNSSMRLSADSPDTAQEPTEQPSNPMQTLRFSRFSVAVLIGVGATLGWQTYVDDAREVIIEHVPTLASLLTVPKLKSPVVATSTPELSQQLIPLTFGLDVMRRSVDQLVAKQEQMAQNIAALQVVDEDVRQKVSSPPPQPPPTSQAVPIEQPKPQHKAQALHSRLAPRQPTGGTGFVPR